MKIFLFPLIVITITLRELPAQETGKTLSQWIDRTPIISHSSDLPPGGEDCAVIYDPKQHRIVLFGGKNDADQLINELWMLDLTANAWQKIEVAGESPPPTEDHTVIYDPLKHRMILHGGEDGPTWNNTWSLDLKNYLWYDITDSIAPAREDHTAIYDNLGKRMVVYGGQEEDEPYSEIWSFNLDPDSENFEKWQKLDVDGNQPMERYDHVAVFDEAGNRMLINGGWDDFDSKYLGDTWAFSFDTNEWKQLKTKKSYPPRRRRAESVYDSSRNWWILFGGFGERGYLNDVWAFDLTANVWFNITPGPQPRIDHHTIFDPKSQRLILYGGDARLGPKFHDVWELQIEPEIPVKALLKEAGAKRKKKPKK